MSSGAKREMTSGAISGRLGVTSHQAQEPSHATQFTPTHARCPFLCRSDLGRLGADASARMDCAGAAQLWITDPTRAEVALGLDGATDRGHEFVCGYGHRRRVGQTAARAELS